MHILTKIIEGIQIGAIALASALGIVQAEPVAVVQPPAQEITYGAAPQFVAGTTYNLSGGGIGSSATSITLQSFTIPQTGQELATADLIGGVGDKFYITIEPGSRTKQEIVSCTAVSQSLSDTTATLSGCTRGLSPITPYTASTTLAFSHAGGSQVIVSNPPQLYDSIIDYVDAATVAGAVDASLTAKGILEVASAQEAASTTATGGGSTSAPLALTTTLSTSTYNAATAGLKVVMTQNDGKIDNNFLNFSTTTSIGAFPVWQVGKQKQIITTTGTSTFTVPSGITKLLVEVVGGGGPGGSCDSIGSDCGGAGGGGGGYSSEVVDVTGTTTIQVYVGTAGQWTTFGTNGFYLYATGGSGGGSNGTPATLGGTPGCGFSGDINICGTAGTNGIGAATVQSSGTGGSSHYGGGGRGSISEGTGGSAGSLYGGGGGGGLQGGATGGGTGGAGSQGIAIIRW